MSKECSFQEKDKKTTYTHVKSKHLGAHFKLYIKKK